MLTKKEPVLNTEDKIHFLIRPRASPWSAITSFTIGYWSASIRSSTIWWRFLFFRKATCTQFSIRLFFPRSIFPCKLNYTFSNRKCRSNLCALETVPTDSWATSWGQIMRSGVKSDYRFDHVHYGSRLNDYF